jgi:hypothetical protein
VLQTENLKLPVLRIIVGKGDDVGIYLLLEGMFLVCRMCLSAARMRICKEAPRNKLPTRGSPSAFERSLPDLIVLYQNSSGPEEGTNEEFL